MNTEIIWLYLFLTRAPHGHLCLIFKQLRYRYLFNYAIDSELVRVFYEPFSSVQYYKRLRDTFFVRYIWRDPPVYFSNKLSDKL